MESEFAVGNTERNQAGNPEFRKKKKKKSFLKQAKKHGERGHFGKGHDIDASTYNYFVQVLDTLGKNEFEDEDSKEIFVANVFNSNSEEEEKLCCNQLVSRVFEKLLPLAPSDVKTRIMTKLGSDLRLYVTNPFASHILETLLTLASFKQKSEQESSQEFSEFRREWVLKVSKYCINNLSEFAQDSYASHVLRSIFQCLAGFQLSKDLLRSKKSQGQAQTNLDLSKIETTESIFDANDDEIQGVFALICKKVEDLEDINEICNYEISSEVLQCLLLVLCKKSGKLCKKLGKHITNEVFADLTIEMFGSLGGSIALTRLMEIIIQVSGTSDEKMEKLYNHFYGKLFKTRLAELAVHPQANFSVQKLLLNCPSKETFEEMFENELDPNFEKIFQSNNSGVVLSIGQTCRKLGAKQSHFLVALMKTLKCFEENHQNKFLLNCAKLTPTDTENSKKINLHGTLLVQEILQFNKPIKMVNSLLNTDPEKLSNLLSDPRGSHITDAFMLSASIGEKSRENLLKTLNDYLVNLACSKHGSRSIDAIWNKASPKLRENLASRLVNSESKLNSDQYGKFVSINIGLSIFKRSKEQWLGSFDKQKKTKELFSDFITNKKPNPERKEEFSEFMIEKSGDENLLKRKVDDVENVKEKKKKKKVAKSYLDDL